MANKLIELVETLDFYLESGMITEYTIKRKYDESNKPKSDIRFTSIDDDAASELRLYIIKHGYADIPLDILLQEALLTEDYELAASLRDSIENKNKK